MMPEPLFVANYFACFDGTWTDEIPAEQVRFVALDTETTGLDPQRDRLITIGAVAVVDHQILLQDSLEVMMPIAYNSASVTVHGITRDEAETGLEESAALCEFLGYLKDAVIVGHHIAYDIAMLNAGYRRHFGFELRNRSLDTLDLILHLERDGAFAGSPKIRSFDLDTLCDRFGLKPHDRHTAGGDAFLTAEVLLRLLRLGRRFHRHTLAALCEPFVPAEAE